jgi:hypothetical protein
VFSTSLTNTFWRGSTAVWKPAFTSASLHCGKPLQIFRVKRVNLGPGPLNTCARLEECNVVPIIAEMGGSFFGRKRPEVSKSELLDE